MRYLITTLLLIFPTLVIAQQTTDIAIQVANKDVAKSVEKINELQSKIADYSFRKNQAEQTVNDIAAVLTKVEQESEENKISITYLATKENPVQSAIDTLNANPSWAVGVDWEETDYYKESVNLKKAQPSLENVNWSEFNNSNVANWTSDEMK